MTKDLNQMSLPLDSPVSLSQQQERGREAQATKISGRKLLELSRSADPLGLLEKMLMESLTSISTPYLRTWKAKATPQGALILALRASVRTTKGQGSGLLPTPANYEDRTSVEAMQKMDKKNFDKKMSNLSTRIRMIPTPTSSEHKATKKWREGHHNSLTAAMFNPEKLLPTPCARDFKDSTVSPAALMRRTLSLPIVLMQQEQPKTGGKLNPNFLEYLMGYDTDYTNIEQTE